MVRPLREAESQLSCLVVSERLTREAGVRVRQIMMWYWLRRTGVTFKNSPRYSVGYGKTDPASARISQRVGAEVGKLDVCADDRPIALFDYTVTSRKYGIRWLRASATRTFNKNKYL